MSPRFKTIRYEQAIYGTFPFWHKGYAVLGQSPGCRPQWLQALRDCAVRIGEPPRNSAVLPAVSVVPLATENIIMIVGVSSPGADDRGRPDAMAFHALFLDAKTFRALAGRPFLCEPLLIREFTPAMADLPAGLARVRVTPPEASTASGDAALRIAQAMQRGQKVVVFQESPIDDLAAQVWECLPFSRRSQKKVRTYGFSWDASYDLLGLPPVFRLNLNAAQSPASAEFLNWDQLPPPVITPRWSWSRRDWTDHIVMSSVFGLSLAAGVFAGRLDDRSGDRIPINVNANASSVPAVDAPGRSVQAVAAPVWPAEPAPDRSQYRYEDNVENNPVLQAEVRRGLLDLAKNFHVKLPQDERSLSINDLSFALSDQLRYHGPWLSLNTLRSKLPGAENASLSDADRELRLWHEHIALFSDERKLPEGFADGPLRWRLDCLTWLYHLSQKPSLSPPEIPHDLANRLGLSFVPHAETVLAEHPYASDYARFLQRLPVSD